MQILFLLYVLIEIILILKIKFNNQLSRVDYIFDFGAEDLSSNLNKSFFFIIIFYSKKVLFKTMLAFKNKSFSLTFLVFYFLFKKLTKMNYLILMQLFSPQKSGTDTFRNFFENVKKSGKVSAKDFFKFTVSFSFLIFFKHFINTSDQMIKWEKIT